jgi:hypothetical protein
LLLTTIFLLGLAATAATLAAIGRIAETGAATPSGARMREAPPLPATSQVYSQDEGE